ncbi:MAG TPA: peptide ABC transporter substrate-binding protein [Candidatus Saccharimonadales bacterium]|nr:peptide ABC transporter substrate-binding protein [Candidatus Saccharimonadales bacterium]
MAFRLNKRKLHKRQQQVEALGVEVESMAERHFFRRLERLVPVRRFVVAWLLFFVLLSGCLIGQIRALDGQYRSLQPIAGGVYTEGILGDFTNANPLYAANEVDKSVSSLLFASLLTYDNDNRLVGDLAESWTVDASERVYTVVLRPGLTWHDGAPLTASDVVFTYQLIQNPDVSSVLRQSWKDITVAATNDRTVTFTLPNQLSAFQYHLTNGIVPQHLLKDIASTELRAAPFNTLSPVGSGPFMWQELEVSGETPEDRQQKIALLPFKQYHAGAPKLATFVVNAFHDRQKLAQSFEQRELTAASFLELPEGAREDDRIKTNDFILTAANMVFFRQSNPLFSDVAVRRALVQGADVADIMTKLEYPTRAVKGPLLPGQLGYDKTLLQPPHDPAAAAAALEAAGWKQGSDGYRAKGPTPLGFVLQSQDTPELRMVTEQLKQDWQKIGVKAEVQLKDSENLQRSITAHEYDALLYGISLGVDPDVFVYWHSSQNDPRSNRLNFSEYKSKVADSALEGGRTRSDAALRAVKYKPFLQAWQQDVPALGLYQPRYLYATHGEVFGLEPRIINTDVDRFNNVHQWQIRQGMVTNSPR